MLSILRKFCGVCVCVWFYLILQMLFWYTMDKIPTIKTDEKYVAQETETVVRIRQATN